MEAKKEGGDRKGSEERAEIGNRHSIEAVFLTKESVETPNLFLSYITKSSSLSLEILQAILRYGLSLSKVHLDI